jgi:hypothetical protein
MTYNINPQKSQDSVAEMLREEYPHIPVIEDGLLDDDNGKIKTYDDGSVKPFIVLWFQTPRRLTSGRSFAGARLDQRVASADIVVVARSGTEARRVMNDIIDRLIGFKPYGSGVVVESDRQLWRDSRKIDTANRPSRWAIPYSVEWGIFSKKTI